MVLISRRFINDEFSESLKKRWLLSSQPLDGIDVCDINIHVFCEGFGPVIRIGNGYREVRSKFCDVVNPDRS